MPKKVSTTQRGNYYKKKTQAWYEAKGYKVELCEFMCGRQIAPGRIIYQKKDVLKSDGIAWNDKEFILWNSKHFTSKKSFTEQKRVAKKEYSELGLPEYITQKIIFWEPRVKEPIVIDPYE